MRILSLYIGRNVLVSTLLVVVIMLGIQSFLEFAIQFSDIGVLNYTIGRAFLFVPLQLPMDLYQLFPMAGFLGCLIGLGRLANSSELIAMQAAGMSVNQIAKDVLKAAILMIVIVIIIGEVFGPQLQNQAYNIKEKALGKAGLFDSGRWIHQGDKFVYVQKMISPHEIANVMVYQFDKNQQLINVSAAKKGILVHGQWQLIDVVRTHMGAVSGSGTPINVQKIPIEKLDIVFNPQVIYQPMRDSVEDSVWNLYQTIRNREQMGLITTQFEFSFWQRLVKPFTAIVMICLGIPFIFGSLRHASMGSRILTGVIVGFIFYMFNQFLGPFTLVYQFPPILAAVLPTLVFLLIYIFLVRRIRSY